MREIGAFLKISFLLAFFSIQSWACTIRLRRHRDVPVKAIQACSDTLTLRVDDEATVGEFFDLLDALKKSTIKQMDLNVRGYQFKQIILQDIVDRIDAGAEDSVSDLNFMMDDSGLKPHLLISSGP